MRKVLSFVLVLSLVLGSFAMAFAAPLSDIAGKDFEDAVNVLTELEVVSGYPDGTFKPGNIVTRAEMAVIVVRALGLADYATGTSNFKDMAGHWSNPYVAYATSLGAIAGYPDGTFKPDKTVSYDEAATMLVAALGYTPDSLVGTWPANYVTKAKSLGIIDGVKAGATGANRGDIAIMAFQTLGQSLGKTDKDGVWNPNIIEAGPPIVYETLLDRLGAELYDPGAGPGKPFLLNDTLADTAVANVRDYIGAWVTAYVNSDGDIIAIKDVKTTFLTGKFTTSAGTTTIAAADKFKANDVEYGFAKAVNPADFLNGKVTGVDTTFNTTTEFTLAVEVSGKTIKEVRSVNVWTPNAAAQVTKSQIAAIDKDMKLLGKSFKKDDNREIDLASFALIGVKSLSDIKVDDVVYVYDSGVIRKVEVSNKVVSGEVTRLKDGKYTIDGKAYSAYTGAGNNGVVGKLNVGDEVDAYIGPDGKIFDFEKIAGKADKIGIILNTGDVTGSGLNDTPDAQVKLLLADGTTKTFVVDEDVYNPSAGPTAIVGLLGNDGVWGNTTPANAAGSGTAAPLVGTAVKYEINKDGDISALAKVVWEGAAMVAPDQKLTKKGTFAGFNVDADALIISYKDADGALPYTSKAADYSILKLNNLLDTTLVFAYYTLNDADEVDFLYISSTTSSTDDIFAVVVAVEKNSSDAGYGVDMLINGEEVYKDSENYYSGANAIDTDGEFQALWKVTYDAKGVATLAAHGLGGALVTINFDGVTPANNPTVSGNVVTYGAGPSKATLDSDVVVYVWNATDKVYEVGSINDIEDLTANVYLFDTDSTKDNIYDIVLVI